MVIHLIKVNISFLIDLERDYGVPVKTNKLVEIMGLLSDFFFFSEAKTQ